MSAAQISKAFEEEKELHQRKSRLIQFLAATNDIHVIKKFDKLLFKLVNSDDEIVGQTPDGRPMTRKDLDLKFEKSFEQIRNGETISLEDAEKEAESWL